jgi:hypothetical protein
VGVIPAAPAPAEHSGLRDLVETLVEANLARAPGRALKITHREAAALVATDAELAVTVQMLPGALHAPGSVLIHDGEDPWAEIAIHAPSVGLLELAATPLRFGLPDVSTPDGRDVVRQLVRREIRVRGMVRHLGTARRLSILLSVR